MSSVRIKCSQCNRELYVKAGSNCDITTTCSRCFQSELVGIGKSKSLSFKREPTSKLESNGARRALRNMVCPCGSERKTKNCCPEILISLEN